MADTFFLKNKKNNNFTILDKTCINDPNLSWKAKGLHTYLMSLPDDWKIYLSEIEKHSKDGRDSLHSAINELINAGYIVRKRERNIDGTYGATIYYINEQPNQEITVDNESKEPETEKPFLDKKIEIFNQPETGFPYTDNPDTVKPYTENPQLLSINNTNNINLLSTKLTNSTKKTKTDDSKKIELINEQKRESQSVFKLTIQKYFPGPYLFDSDFEKKVNYLFKENQIDIIHLEQYINFCYKMTLDKKPNKSTIGLFYKIATNTKTVLDFKMLIKNNNLINTAKKSKICPVCEKKEFDHEEKIYNFCKNCGFNFDETDKIEIEIQRKIFKLPLKTKSQIYDEIKNLPQALNFQDFFNEKRKIYKKYEILRE